METVARRRCRHNDHRALAVTAVKRLHKIALLGLRGQTRRRAAALYVHNHQRQLGHDGKTHSLAFERQTGTRGGGHGEVAGIGGTDRGADAGDLILGLHRLHAQILALGQLFEDDRRRRNGIRTAEERQTGLLGSGAEAPCRSHVAVDRTIGSLFQLCRSHRIGVGELVCVGRIVVTGVDSALVGLGHERIFLSELALQVLFSMVFGTVVYPEADAQCKHVLALDHRFVVKLHVGQRLAGHGRDVGRHDIIVRQSKLLDRIERCEARLADVILGKRVAVEDDRRTRFEPLAIGLQRRGVHRNQHVAVIARVVDAIRTEMHLKARYARYRTLRSANLGRIVGERRNAVAQQSRCVRKECTRKLHAVARIARKTNHDILQLLYVYIVHFAC